MEWIEIGSDRRQAYVRRPVSTLAVEWIEIKDLQDNLDSCNVSTLAVEWIEIMAGCGGRNRALSLHPRGGVD